MPLKVSKRLFTLSQAIEAVQEDENVDAVVVIPPENQGDVSDEEEDLEPNVLPNDVAGELEVERRLSDGDTSDDDDDDDSAAAPPKKSKSSAAKKEIPKWKRSKDTFATALERNAIDSLIEERPELAQLTPFELYEKFFADVADLVLTETNRYAGQRNKPADVTKEELYRFCGIVILSGYHTLPAQHLYWSTDEDMGVPLVSNSMSRNRFTTIKSVVHLADNDYLVKEDRGAKVRPYFDLLNEKLCQFEIFSEHLSVDEQMVPYYGKHGAKQFMHNKPVKFGYKFWVLSSSSGYPFKVKMYLGKSEDREDTPLGTYVVDSLLQSLTDPTQHTVTMDNFFGSYTLLDDLRRRGVRATSTVRKNRLQKAPLPEPKDWKKQPRGAISSAGDGKVISCCWNDNRPVYVASNHFGVKPTESKRRYSQKDKTHIQVPCPKMIDHYNATMGGVDLTDRFLSNYRPSITGKKWWFSLFLHGINLMVVASWRMHKEVGGKLSQLEFTRYVARCLLKYSADATTPLRNLANLPRAQLPDIRFDGIGHINSKGFKEGRCKVCSKNTFQRCDKCNVRVHPKCFWIYHSK